jgi:hypothetical protein
MTTIAEVVELKNTQAWIDENSVEVSFMARRKVSTADGGWEWQNEAPMLPQKARLVYSGNKGDSVQRTLSDGQVVVVQATLVFMPGAQVEPGWLCELNEGGETHQWIVAFVSRTPARRVSAEVSRHASTA